MKPLYTSVLAILVTVTIVGMLTISTQQVSAFGFVEHQEFKKLTKDFEKMYWMQQLEIRKLYRAWSINTGKTSWSYSVRPQLLPNSFFKL